MSLVDFDEVVVKRRHGRAIGSVAAAVAVDSEVRHAVLSAAQSLSLETLPSCGFLLLVGLIGGGPTFFGTLLGQAWVNEAVSIAFFALAAGSILYVVIELLNVCRRLGRKTVIAWGLTVGLMLGFATDFVLVAAGA